MANRTLLGLYRDVQGAVDGADALREAGFSNREYDVLTDTPYPEETFGEHVAPHKLFVFPLIGAFCGFAVAILLTVGTQISYPLVTGGKPIIAVPAMMIIMYEGTMLGAIIFTVMGLIFESRLPRFNLGIYDPRITEGYIGLVVSAPEERFAAAESALRKAGAEAIRHDRETQTTRRGR
ncbi:MAG: DUF3341 domain-containing protein [Chloroflexi bacterium]|nr:DUF3341 domain-containing protein [Chloroflexota bacterium]